MSEKTKDWWEGKPTERGNLDDSRLTYDEEMTAKNQLERKGAYIDWKTGRIYAKEFIGDGQGLWNVGEGTGTGPRGEPGPQGEKGDKGDPGDPGADGKDYDPSALDDLQRQININKTQSLTNKEDIEGLESEISVNKSAIQRHEEMIKGNTAKIATNSSDIFDLQQAVDNIEIPELNLEGYATEEYVDTAIEGIEFPETDLTGLATEEYVDTAIEGIEFPEPDLDGLVTKEEFENHAKLNVASFAVVEKEIVRVAEEVLLNYEDIKKNEEAIEDKASKKYVDDAIEGIPSPDLSDYATINYVDDAIEGIPVPDLSGYMPLNGNSTKTGKLTLKTNDPTPFSIKAGNGTPILNVWASGAISLEKSYNDFKDNELVSKKYVDDSIEGISAPDLSDYMTEAETVEFVDSMDKLNLASANANARTYDRELKADLEGQIADAPYLPKTGGQLDGALTIKKGTQVALDIVGDNNNSQIKFWSSGAVALQNYTAFKDNELVTKKYVDDKVSSDGGGFTAGDAVAKTNGESNNVGGFWISNGNLYCKVS